MRFRTDEKVAVRVPPKRCTEVSQKVVAAAVIGTANEVAGEEWLIEPHALNSDAGHEFPAYVPALRSVDPVKVEKYRTERLNSRIQILACPPRNFTVESELVLKQQTSAEIQVSAST